MAHRDFDAEAAERLAKQGLPTLTMKGETFTLRDDVNPDAMIAWDSLGPDSKASQSEQLRMIDDVWVELLIPEDGPRFKALRATPNSPGLVTLLEGAKWAMEQLTSRPFESSDASGGSPGGATVAASSTVPRSLAAVEASAASASATP